MRPKDTTVSMFSDGSVPQPRSPTISTGAEHARAAAQGTPHAPPSPTAADRVFPVRSVVSVDPNATPMQRGESGDGFPGLVLGHDGNTGPRRQSFQRTSTMRTASPARSDTSHTTDGSLSRVPEGSYFPTADEGSQASERTRQLSGATDPASGLDPRDLSNMMRDDVSVKSEGAPSTDGGVSLGSKAGSVMNTTNRKPGYVTARFKHVVTDGGHAVITGRDGETLQNCEDEPIHIPGAVQSFGLLIAFREESNGKLVVRIVSENSTKIIGYTPEQLFRLDNLLDILNDEQADNLLDHLDFIRDEDAADVGTNGPEVFMLSIRSPKKRTQKLWCAMHIAESNKDLVICEFELEDDQANPLMSVGEGTPEPPEETLGSNPTPEEYAESTVNLSKPLRVLRSARKKKGEAAAMEVFNIMSQVQEQLGNATTLEVFLRVLIGVVKELTGFHRVMIYQFDEAWNGRVVAELLDPRATKDLFKGLHFPASDIPKQARDLYKINKVRLLYDRDQETARLVCRTLEDLERPLDLTYSYLRAMSPIHIKYLANMGVRASMSISINGFSELWGLISCHTYGQKGTRVSFPIRKMCRLVGDTASRNIERLSYASRIQARKLINTMPTATNPSGYIVASSDDLLKLFDADFGALSIREETKILGKPEHTQEILAMLEFLRLRQITSVMTSQDVNIDFPDLKYQPGFKYIAGLLFVPLTTAGRDFIVFFRVGQLKEVKWAGNPYEKFVKEGTEGYLEPRKSFKIWSETVVGRCRDWTEEELETAAVLCLVYGKFIEVWRQKEVAVQNTELTRLLLANSAHEVRTPLNAIINYLEIALEGSLDCETRENLARSHSASKSLIYVINDLLDLTKTEEGKDLIKFELFDLPATMREVTDVYQGDAKRKAIEFNLHEYPGIPQHVIGDQRRVRQVISNLLANAIQHTSSGSVNVEVYLCSTQVSTERIDVEFAIEDTGAGMSQVTVDSLFRGFEQVTSAEDEGLLDSDLEKKSKAMEGKEKALGLGLAIVARIIKNMNGQLRLKSEEGKGSRFVVQLGFDLPEHRNKGLLADAALRSDPTSPGGALPVTPPATEGEVFLVNRSTSRRTSTKTNAIHIPRRASADSVASNHSTKSVASIKSVKSAHSAKSAMSDVDRLIDAIQEPLMKDEPTEPKSVKRSSKGVTLGRRGSGGGRDGSPSRGQARSYDSGMVRRADPRSVPGQEAVTDSRTPIRPVKMPEDDEGAESLIAQTRTPSKVLFDIPDDQKQIKLLGTEHLGVLVAEDDPINSKIIKKRLEKLGHNVQLTVNGEECASMHGEKAKEFDVVLMDLQVRRTCLPRSHAEVY